jgi:NhaA family Na+:H+ antiporter
MVVMNMLGVRRLTPYAFPAALVWYFMLQSGVHATLAGILAALAIPCRPRLDLGDFNDRMDHLLDTVKQGARSGAFFEMAIRIKQVESPLERLERWLHPWVAFFIVPVFALANAGVKLGGDTGGEAGSTVIMGIALGLIVGKLVGIFGFSFLAVKLGFGALPQGVNWTKIAGAASLAGIGFTMSLFIGGLAFKQAPELIDAAKIGILAASGVSAVIGMTFLFIATRDSAKQAKEE